MIDELENLPDISFIDNTTLTDIQAEMVLDFQDRYEELTGKTYKLYRADPISLLIYATAVQIYQTMLYVDKAGKMDMLKYSTGDYLDNMAALKGLTRYDAEAAITTIRFSISEAQASAISIDQGTRITDGTTYFVTSEYAELPAGDLYIDVPAVCQTEGIDGNGITVGALNTLVDDIPYIETVSNLTETAGGTDVESDEDFRDRIYLAPSGYSVAGPLDAYIYWAKAFSTDIEDVAIDSPDAGEVDVYFITTGGAIPTSTQIAALQAWLEDENIRPLTDQVTVMAPTTVTFNVTVTYYIAKSDSSKASTIQTEVANAVDSYIEWQQRAIGRDINPDKLIKMMLDAGAKRAVISYPAFTSIPATSIAQLGTKTVTYGGLEND